MLPPVAILAGGLATRLRGLTERTPKALLDINGTPFIVHQLAQLHRSGVGRVVLCVGHLGEMIRAVVGDGSQQGLAVAYSFDGATLLGTAGALKKAQPLLGDEFFVLYGDSYLYVSYADVYREFRRVGMPALMTVYRNEGRWDASNAMYAPGTPLMYDKQHPSPDMHYIDYGLGVLRADALASVPADAPSDLSDVYSALSGAGQLAGYEATERFFEIGSRDGLAALRRHLMDAHDRTAQH